MTTPTSVRPWLRLPHRALDMPVPAVYAPLEDLGDVLLRKLGFVYVGDSEKQDVLPTSGHLAADVMSDPHTLTLFVFKRDFRRPTGEAVSVVPDLAVIGTYATPAEEAWQNEAYTAGCIILLVGSRVAGHPGAVEPPVVLNSESVLTGVSLASVT